MIFSIYSLDVCQVNSTFTLVTDIGAGITATAGTGAIHTR